MAKRRPTFERESRKAREHDWTPGSTAANVVRPSDLRMDINLGFMRSKSCWLVAVSGLLALSSCAPWGASQQETMLLAAGFRERHPETPYQQKLYDQAPSYKLLHGVINGQSVYAYKDRNKGFAYVGGPTDYHRYRELSYQEERGRVDYVEEEMSTQMASGWYDAWSGRTGLSGGPLEVAVPNE
jgi:hypothetical protein